MHPLVLEVIVTNLDEAVQAYEAGADRVELVSAIREGGLTPDFSMVQQIVSTVPIRLHAMVRPHSQSFSYDHDVIEDMYEDIRRFRVCGAHGVVVGALTRDGRIDMNRLRRLVDAADGMSVTFHRAFDEVRDQEEALEQLLTVRSIDRVLSGRPSALDGVTQIKRLVQLTEDTHLTVLAGSGLTSDSIAAFVRQTGVKEVHFGKGVRYCEQSDAPIDPAQIRRVKKLTGIATDDIK